MNPKAAIIGIASLIGLAVGIAAWRGSIDPTNGENFPSNTQSNRPMLQEATAAPPEITSGRRAKGDGVARLQTVDRLEEYIEKQDVERPEILVLAFELTQDPKFLQLAQAKFPDDINVIIASAALEGSGDWLHKWIAAEPDNALPHLIDGILRFNSGDGDDLRAAYEMVATTPGMHLNAHTRDRIATRIDYLIDQGEFDYENYSQLKYTDLDKKLYGPLENHSQALLAEIQSIKGTGASRATEIASDMMLLAHLVSTSTDFSDLDSLFLQEGLEYSFLAELDPSIEYGEAGGTVGERLAEMEQGGRLAQDLFELRGRVSSFEPSVRTKFLTRLQRDGEIPALIWLAEEVDAPTGPNGLDGTQ